MVISNKKLPKASMINLSLLMIFVFSVSYLQGASEQYTWHQPIIGTKKEAQVIENFNRVQYKQSDNGLADDSALLNLVKDTTCFEHIKKEIQYRVDKRIDAITMSTKELKQDSTPSLPVLESQTFLNKWWYKKPLKYMSTDIKAPCTLEAELPINGQVSQEDLNKMYINGLANRAQLYAQLYNQLDAIKENKANISALHIELLFDVCNSLHADKDNQSETVKKNVETFLKQQKNWFENRHDVYNKAIISDCDDSDFIDYYIKTYFPLIGETDKQYVYDCTPTLLFLQRVQESGYEMAANISYMTNESNPLHTHIGISVIVNKKNPIFIQMYTALYENPYGKAYLDRDSFYSSCSYLPHHESEHGARMQPMTLYPYAEQSEKAEKKRKLLKFIDRLQPMCFYKNYIFTYEKIYYCNDEALEIIRTKPRRHAVLYKFQQFKELLKLQNTIRRCNQDLEDIELLEKECSLLDEELKDLARKQFESETTN